METKFSKGEWKVIVTTHNELAVRNEGGLICRIFQPSRWPDQMERYLSELEEARANAILISKAPELFNALSSAIKFIKSCPELENEERLPKGLEKWEQILADAVK